MLFQADGLQQVGRNLVIACLGSAHHGCKANKQGGGQVPNRVLSFLPLNTARKKRRAREKTPTLGGAVLFAFYVLLAPISSCVLLLFLGEDALARLLTPDGGDCTRTRSVTLASVSQREKKTRRQKAREAGRSQPWIAASWPSMFSSNSMICSRRAEDDWDDEAAAFLPPLRPDRVSRWLSSRSSSACNGAPNITHE